MRTPGNSRCSGTTCYQCGSQGQAAWPHPPGLLSTQAWLSAGKPGLQIYLRGGGRGGWLALNVLGKGVWGGCFGFFKVLFKYSSKVAAL